MAGEASNRRAGRGTRAVIVGDGAGWRILRRDTTGSVTVLAGNGALGFAGDGGPPTSAFLSRPAGLARDARGRFCVAESGGHRVRCIDPGSATISTVVGSGSAGFAGDGTRADGALLNAPEGITFDREGRLLIADTGNHRVRRVAGDGTIMTVAGSGRDGLARDRGAALEADIGRPSAVAVDVDGTLLVVQGQYGLIHRLAADGTLHTIVGSQAFVPLQDGAAATSGRVEQIAAIALASDGSILFAEQGMPRIWSVDRATGRASVIAGRGHGPPRGSPGEAFGVTLGFIRGLGVDASGNVYVVDMPHGLRRIDAGSRRVTTIAEGMSAAQQPAGLFVDAEGTLYVADGAGYVRRLDATGRPVTVAGGGPGF